MFCWCWSVFTCDENMSSPQVTLWVGRESDGAGVWRLVKVQIDQSTRWRLTGSGEPDGTTAPAHYSYQLDPANLTGTLAYTNQPWTCGNPDTPTDTDESG